MVERAIFLSVAIALAFGSSVNLSGLKVLRSRVQPPSFAQYNPSQQAFHLMHPFLFDEPMKPKVTRFREVHPFLTDRDLSKDAALADLQERHKRALK